MKREDKTLKHGIIYIAAAILTAVILSLIFVSMYEHAKQNILTSNQRSIMHTATQIDYFLLESIDSLQLSSFHVNKLINDGKSNEDILDYLLNESKAIELSINKNFTGLYGLFRGTYLDGIGWVPDDGYEPTTRPWYTAAMEGNGEISLVTPYVDALTGSVMMSICKMLPDRESVISLDMTLDGIQELLTENLLEYSWDEVYVMNKSGYIITHSDQALSGTNLPDEKLYNAIVSNTDGDDAYFVYGIDGISYVIYTSMIQNNWILVTTVRESSLIGDLRRNYVIYFIILLLVLTASISSVLINRRRAGSKDAYSSRLLTAISRAYVSIYVIDLRDDTFHEIASNDSAVKAILKDQTTDAQMMLRLAMDARTSPRYKNAIFEFIDFKTLPDRLRNRSMTARSFISVNNIRMQASFIPLELDEDKNVVMVIWMVENVDIRKGKIIFAEDNKAKKGAKR